MKFLIQAIPLIFFMQHTLAAPTEVINKSIQVLESNNSSDDTYKITQHDLFISNDLITTSPNPLIKKMKNGEDREVDIKIDVKIKMPENVKEFNINNINSMIGIASSNAQAGLKNKYTYIPRAIQILDVKDGELVLALKYTAENSYGGNVVGTKLIKFNSKGGISFETSW